MINRFKLFRLLRHNDHLGYRRSPTFEQSMVAKVMMVLGSMFFVLYLIIYGTMFGWMAVSGDSANEPTMIFVILPLLLLIDFGIRFMVQQTPLMLVKPYMLLPIPRNSVIETFLVTSVLSAYNWLWLTFFLPYCVIIFSGGSGFWLALSVLLSGMMIILVNSQFYLMMRTLVARSIFWWVVPIVVYGWLWSTFLIDKKGRIFEDIADVIVDFSATAWFPLLCLLVLIALLWANRKMQFAFVYEEVSREEKKDSAVKHISTFSFLERFGEMGEYLKLELKSIFRNKAIRSRFIMSLSLIIVFCALVAYTPIYDGQVMLNFWCYYCFGLYGVTSLVKIMGPEGNYIDMLMVHRENIISLLRAKYYFHCAILIIPFLVMLPAVIEGKFSILMMLAYMFTTSGTLYAIMFQLAVYNKQVLPLNQKMTGKGNMENGLQLIIEMVGLILPIVFMTVLLLTLDTNTAYIIAAVVGLIITLLHPWWIRNIYGRMMRRKYENLEGFHATR